MNESPLVSYQDYMGKRDHSQSDKHSAGGRGHRSLAIPVKRQGSRESIAGLGKRPYRKVNLWYGPCPSGSFQADSILWNLTPKNQDVDLERF